MASSMSQHGDGGFEFEPLLRVLNDLQPPKIASPTKQPEPANQTYQTNVHVDDLLKNYDAWLRQNGVSAIRVTSDTVYYQYLCATTEEEKKKERRFVDIAGHPGYVGLEGHKNINNDAAILRAAEHAFIVWTAQNQAAQALSRAKDAQKRVLQNVARVHPEARKKLETFESGLEAERLRMVHREMQAQLDFEKHQKQQLQKLNERLEQQRREFLGMDAGEAMPTERAYLPPTIASLNPAGVNYASKPDYASQLFSGIKSPVKPAAATIPLAFKKPQEEKKESFYPRFMHAAQLFRVEKYGGDPTVGGHLQRDSEGQVVHFRPWKAPCVPGCRECVQYEQSDVL
ncbi:uncharacterized protein J3D65DRAFT_626077 [Phyllosticta citribraziliensis]|uniref:Uncharacterized protein n=1 Tax=Phyllosticta citribraziliensis TaxID=989973 RepID=A0ABR1LSP8_9PEZI